MSFRLLHIHVDIYHTPQSTTKFSKTILILFAISDSIDAKSNVIIYLKERFKIKSVSNVTMLMDYTAVAFCIIY